MNKKERNRYILKVYMEEGLSMEKVAARVGVSTSTVYSVLHSFEEFEPRTRSDYRKHDYDQVYHYIKEVCKKEWRPPTMQDICDELDIPMGETVLNILESLVEEGKLRRLPGKQQARAYVPAEEK